MYTLIIISIIALAFLIKYKLYDVLALISGCILVLTCIILAISSNNMYEISRKEYPIIQQNGKDYLIVTDKNGNNYFNVIANIDGNIIIYKSNKIKFSTEPKLVLIKNGCTSRWLFHMEREESEIYLNIEGINK